MSPPAATQAAARLWIQPPPSFPARLSYRWSVEITRTLWWQTRFTRGRVREWKSGHNSVTAQNRTHVYMNFFDHKDVGNRLLQLCPNTLYFSVMRSTNILSAGTTTVPLRRVVTQAMSLNHPTILTPSRSVSVQCIFFVLLVSGIKKTPLF
jgi:hypothetical protein